MPLDHQTYVKLNNGTLMPQFGMGVYSIPEGGHSADSVREAVRLGYRHFDMSHAGSLEKAAVEMLLSCGVNRDELWITTKLWPSEYRRGKTSEAIDSKLSALGLDYLDLLLQHQQFGFF